MNKFFLVGCFFAALFILVSCSRIGAVETNDNTNVYTITINSPQGESVLGVSESGLINRSVYSDKESNTVIVREYTYDTYSNLRSVVVEDNKDNAYSITYGNETNNSSRSAIDDQDNIPGTVKYISKSTISGSRAASSSLTDVEKIEYYYDENGNLQGIWRIDTNGNMMGKGN